MKISLNNLQEILDIAKEKDMRAEKTIQTFYMF